MGHFRITSGLFYEASLGAHLFICKINFHSHENEFNLHVNENCFAYERLASKKRPVVIRKWLNREFKHNVYGRQQTAKITSDFLFFCCNP